MKPGIIVSFSLVIAMPVLASGEHSQAVSDETIQTQRQHLSENTEGEGFGPQSPRDIDNHVGSNPVLFAEAPDYHRMNLCNIHFHKNAEHKGGEFTRYAGNGDGEGNQSGYRYSGELTADELAPMEHPVCENDHGSLQVGDTVEVHYVHSTAKVSPGPTLAACLSETLTNPQLRVESQVFVLVNDPAAADFGALTTVATRNGYEQAINIPSTTGKPVVYAGSTTGPGYNEKGSPFAVTWAVRPQVMKVNIGSVGEWCQSNIFDENHGHGVRNLVTDAQLLSPIK